MSDVFDWSEFKGDEVVRSARAVIVYLNPDGDVVIRQEAPAFTDEEPWVVIPRVDLSRLIEKLNSLTYSAVD